MHKHRFPLALGLALWSILWTAGAETPAAGPNWQTVASPNGELRFSVRVGEQLFGEISAGQTPIVTLAPLGLEIQGQEALGDRMTILSVDRRDIDETWQPVTGKTNRVRDHAREMTLHLQEQKPENPRRLDLVARAYDDGVAFRYVLPKGDGKANVVVTGERTEFGFLDDHDCWFADHYSFHNSQENQYLPGKLSAISPKALVGMPLLVKVRDDLYAAFTEADVTHWAGMRFVPGPPGQIVTTTQQMRLPGETGPAPSPVETGKRDTPTLRLVLAREADKPTVQTTLPAQSPWRVVMVAKHPGDLIACNLIENLNPPSKVEDTSWIKPGITSWDWWSGRSRMETAEIKKFIQLSADMGWPYMLIDAGWSYHEGQPDSDLTRTTDKVDMPELLRFAKEKNVRLCLWMSWRDVVHNDAYKKAFPVFRDWGIAGVKIDYMDREDQEIVDFYHTMFQATADCHLMLDFHGAYKPTGARRTWPNFITQEGVLGNEQSRGSRTATARHNVTIPYTRGLLGPMDYTPGGFVNQTPAQFQPVEQMHPPGHGTTVPNTRGQELAKFVVFESPLQMACDYPDNYRDQPGADFLQIVKTSWDEVRFLGGEVGESIVLARRSGDDWFIGGMTNEDARTVDVKLDFLPPGKPYMATIWRDAPDADKDATKLVREERNLAAANGLSVAMAPAGGFVVHLTPQR